MLDVKLTLRVDREDKDFVYANLSHRAVWGHKPEVGDVVNTGLILADLDEATIKSVTYSLNGNCTAELEPKSLSESAFEAVLGYAYEWSVEVYD